MVDGGAFLLAVHRSRPCSVLLYIGFLVKNEKCTLESPVYIYNFCHSVFLYI